MKITFLAALLLCGTLSSQQIITVGAAGGGDYHTINEAVAAANSGDSIKVYPGSYYEYISINKKVHLLGLDTTAVLSYTTNGVVYFAPGSDGASISGFSVRKPINLAADVKNILIAANIFDSTSVNGTLANGGAVVMKNLFRLSSVTLSNTGTEKIIIFRNDFTGSASSLTSATISGNVVVSNNTFTGGGTAISTGANTKIYGNTISKMVSAGIRIQRAGNIEIKANRIKTINVPGIQVDLGYPSITLPNSEVCNNLFQTGTNYAVYWSLSTYGSTYSTSVNMRFRNNVIFSSIGLISTSGNTNYQQINDAASSFLVLGSIIMNCSNTFSPRSFITVENSCFYNNGGNSVPGVGNIYSNPNFVNPTNDDFHLASGSPCIDAGTMSEYDLDRTRADMGIYGGSFSQSNLMSESYSAITELKVTPVTGTQGTTMTVKGSGVADVQQNSTPADAIRKDK